MAQAFHLLEPIAAAGDRQIGDGAVINQFTQVMLLNNGIRAIPTGYL
jgi:hypothetical protein